MSTNKMREALVELRAFANAFASEKCRLLVKLADEAIAADDVERGTVREEFEAMARKKGFSDRQLVRDGGDYHDDSASIAWWWFQWSAEFWQASRAAAPQGAASEDERKDAGWQPIETAPRDGTHVLCVWACAWGEMVYEGWCQSAGTARDGGDFWRSHSLVPVSGRPTHWMPLPAPPTKKEQP